MLETEKHPLKECDEDIAQLYLQTAARDLKKMGVAARSKSMKELQHLAHRLCGPSAFLRLKDMTKLLQGLEQAALGDDVAESNRFLGLLKEKLNDVRRESGLRFP